MKKSTSKSIRSTIFLPFTVLFILVFLIFAGLFVINETKKIRENTYLTIDNNLKSILDGFDRTAGELNTTSQNIAYSNLVKQHFSSYLGYYMSEDTNSKYSDLQNTKELYDILIAIMGPNTAVDQIYLYGNSGGSFGAGHDNSTSQDSVSTHPWYKKIENTHGEKYIFLDKDERLEPFYSYKEGIYCLTLCRKYYNSLNIPQGVIEVKRSLIPLVSSIESYHRSYDEEYFVFNSDGELIYPLPDKANDSKNNYYTYFPVIKDAENNVIDTDNSQYILWQTSSENGFITAAVVEKDNLFKPIYDFIFNAALVLVFACTCIIFMSYTIAKQISTPLGKIHSQLSSFELNYDNLAEKDFEEIKTSITEINTLYRAFLNMQSQARESLKREIELKNSEMQSRMLALQAQMNPHFLYNSLATIQAMADEGMTEEIYLMCQNMSDILRYISSDAEQLVSLKDELKHTRAYLECMKIRYEDELAYNIDIKDDMDDIKIPKLCLQLIVENAIKFAVQKKSPWVINMTGYKTSSDWEIKIMDNGPGFSDEVLESLMEKIKNIDETGVLPNLEISGMGLMNIYIRFKLLYKGQHVFKLANNESEGACITIGGTIV